jgi:hypothetical protein
MFYQNVILSGAKDLITVKRFAKSAALVRFFAPLRMINQ